MRSKNRKQRTIMLGVLCCMLVFMGIGYSIFSTELNIGGTTTATNTWSILIESITPIENQTGAESKSATVDDVTKTGVSFSAQFQGPGDYIEYDVVVTNKGSIDARLETITNTITPESDAGLFEFTNNLVQGEGLKAGASRTFRVKVLFKPNATTLPTGQMTFNLDLNYIQGEGTDIGGGNGGADTTWDYKVDESGTITAYNYELGKDLVVPAEVNGVPVTTITADSFKQSNAIMYQDGETMGIIITDEENYEALKEKFISWYTTECNGSESCLAQYQAIVISKEGEVTLSDSAYTQAGYIDLETGVFGEAKASINSLDLSEATSLTTIEAKALRNAGLTSVEFGDNSSVTMIGNNAFQNNSLTSVEIPSSVETIGSNAFRNSGIQSLTFETKPEAQGQLNKNNKYSLSRMSSILTKLTSQKSALKSIGDYAFQSNSIKSLTLPEGLETIGSSAFAGNGIQGKLTLSESLISLGEYAFSSNSISEVNIPENLTEIGSGAFDSNAVKILVVPKELPNVAYAFTNNPIETLTIEQCDTTICGEGNYFGNQIKTLKIDSGEIGLFAFSGSEDNEAKIHSLILGEGVTSIDTGAFKNNAITVLELPSTITTIGPDAFLNNQINTLTILGNLTYLESSTFSSNPIENLTIKKCTVDFCSGLYNNATFGTQLKSVTIESGEIGHYAFDSISSLTTKIQTLLLGEGVTSIGNYAFRDAEITQLIVPSTVTSIGNSAFYSNMIDQLVFKTNGGLTIENHAFDSNMIDELVFNTSGELTIGSGAFETNQISGNLVLPEGLTAIALSTFRTNQIVNLTIPSTVTSIGQDSFSVNPTLSSIFINRTQSDFLANVTVSSIRWYDTTLNPTITYLDS